jgi:hypothetical protein
MITLREEDLESLVPQMKSAAATDQPPDRFTGLFDHVLRLAWQRTLLTEQQIRRRQARGTISASAIHMTATTAEAQNRAERVRRRCAISRAGHRCRRGRRCPWSPSRRTRPRQTGPVTETLPRKALAVLLSGADWTHGVVAA